MLLLVALTITILGAQQATTSGPVFEGKTTLLRPVNYREWVFVGSSRGLSYAQTPRPSTEAAAANEMYHNVYIKPESYREFVKTGKFPEGTVLAMELASADTKQEPGLQGSYEKEFIGLEVSVKDSSRFEGGGWVYFIFSKGMCYDY